jgi:DNA polymerase I
MHIDLRKGLSLQQGSFTAIVGPERMIITALNSNEDLRRFLFLFISGNYSHILAHLNRNTKNFEVQRAFTADQLLSMLRAVGHTVVFVEHDASLYDEAFHLVDVISGTLKDLARDALIILYTSQADRSFLALARRADRYIEFIPIDETPIRIRTARVSRQMGIRPHGQMMLEVS